MRVFMLGWEFPPYISGGLGTACFGLTKALSRRQGQISFVLPKVVSQPQATHVRLLTPNGAHGQPASSSPLHAQASRNGTSSQAPAFDPDAPERLESPEAFENVTFHAVPAKFANPYATGPGAAAAARWAKLGQPSSKTAGQSPHASHSESPISVLDAGPGGGPGAEYAGDLMTEAQRYARLCVRLARQESFDVVHAHDWLTFPAGMAVAAATGKPLVVHVHSTEFDRAGENINQQVYDIERRGMHAAVRVIAVSHLTKSILVNRYAVEPDHIDVVYNGIDGGIAELQPDSQQSLIQANDKIVLFLGRITMQKGPEYFVAAARKVLEKYQKVKFVMAGSGDKVAQVIELAAREGIGHKITFTGFLRGDDVSRIFQMADVYVMPSVSEPFGIAALEAIRHDVPVILSRTSGVSEVIKHALKVDFWDVNEMANKIIAVLKHPSLASTLRHHADMEVRHLTWDDAAAQCERVYQRAVAAMPAWK